MLVPVTRQQGQGLSSDGDLVLWKVSGKYSDIGLKQSGRGPGDRRVFVVSQPAGSMEWWKGVDGGSPMRKVCVSRKNRTHTVVVAGRSSGRGALVSQAIREPGQQVVTRRDHHSFLPPSLPSEIFTGPLLRISHRPLCWPVAMSRNETKSLSSSACVLRCGNWSKRR